MSIEIFDIEVEIIRPELVDLKSINIQNTIPAEERLDITVRYLRIYLIKLIGKLNNYFY